MIIMKGRGSKLAEEEAPYACHDHNEGTIVKQNIVNIPLVE